MGSPAYWGQLVNFLASSRKLSLVPFGLFNSQDNINFIADDNFPPPSSDFLFTTAQTFPNPITGAVALDAAVANSISIGVNRSITITQILYNGTSTVPHGAYLYIRYAQDNTGHAVTLPSNLINVPAFTVPTTPNTTTVLPILFDQILNSWKYFGDPFTTGAEPNGQ